MSRVKSAEEKRHDEIEESVMRLLGRQITPDEMGQIFDAARRYNALRNFVDNTHLGAIVASGVYPHLDTEDPDDELAPPAPDHCTISEDTGGDIQAGYGLALDSLADFLDANRQAGMVRDA